MEQYINKSALVAEIDILRKSNEIKEDKDYAQFELDVSCGYDMALDDIKTSIDTFEVKEVDFELIVGWFDHIAQIADDRKTLNGVIMEDWAALDEIKCLARNSSEFIQKCYKVQKGEEI